MRLSLLAACLMLAAAPAFAQTATDAWTSGFVKGVSGASRLPTPSYDSSRLPSQVRVITVRDIERSGAKTLQEVLRTQPGVVLFDEIGNNHQQTIDLRGFNGAPVTATAVLVDGVRINEADFGAVNFQTIDLSEVERIEIVPGPSTMLGRGAMAGAIHIITKRAKKTKGVSVEGELGSFERQRLAAAVNGPVGDLAYRLDASRQLDHGFRSNSAARIHLFSGRLDYKDPDLDGSLTYRYADDDLHQPGSLTASEIGRDRNQNVSRVESDSLMHMVVLDGRRRVLDGLSLAFNAFARQRLSNTPINKGRTSISRARADMGSRGLTLQADLDKEVAGRRSILSAGAEFLRSRTDADSSGAFAFGPFRNGSLTIDRQTGLFVQETFDLIAEKLVLTAGLRHDGAGLQFQDKANAANNGQRHYSRLSPRFGLNYNPVPELETFLSVSDAFRTPTANEISALGPFGSTPELKPVKARSTELGARAKLGGYGQADLSLFQTVVHDEIYAVFDPTAGFGSNRNIPKTRRQGFELSLKPRLGRWEGSFDYTYTEATFQSAFRMDKPPFGATQNVKRGDALPQVPRHRLAFGVSVHPSDEVTLSADELCLGSQHLFGDEANRERRLGATCVAGAGAAYEKGSLRVFLRADNLFDRKYESRGILATNPATNGLERFLMPAAGLTVSGGLRWRFFPKMTP